MNHKKRKKISDYPKQIGAAWYLLGQWISKVDYVEEFTNYHYQRKKAAANPNSVIAAHFSKNKLFKPKYLGLSKLQDHFSRESIIFYKSDAKSAVYTGYGRSAKQARSLPFASKFKIKSKKRIKKGMRSILLGIDIDCHKGEKDGKKVEKLVKKYFKDIYWEDSTGGLGRHGYLKIIFPEKYDVQKLLDILKEILSNLDELRICEGLEAKIDRPTGTPLQIQYLNENPYKNIWETLFDGDRFLGYWINKDSKIFKDYIESLKLTQNQKKQCLKKPSELDKIMDTDSIKNTFRKFINDNGLDFNNSPNAKYACIKSGQAIKLPLFNATECLDTSDPGYGYYLPDMRYLKRFQRSKIYHIKDLEEIHSEVNEDLEAITDLDGSVWETLRDESFLRAMEKRVINSDKSQESPDQPKSKKDNPKQPETKKFVPQNIDNHKYHEIIDMVRLEPDIMKRSSLFINAYISHNFAFREKPTPEQAEQEYVRLGLNRTPRPTKKRKDRFKKFIDGYKRVSNVPLDIVKTWDKDKSSIIEQVRSKILPEELIYGNEKYPRKLKFEEIAFLYYVILKQYEKRSGGIMDCSLSNQQIDSYFKFNFGYKSGRNRSSALKKLLIGHGYIAEMDGYVVGFMGKTYVPIIITPPEDITSLSH